MHKQITAMLSHACTACTARFLALLPLGFWHCCRHQPAHIAGPAAAARPESQGCCCISLLTHMHGQISAVCSHVVTFRRASLLRLLLHQLAGRHAQTDQRHAGAGLNVVAAGSVPEGCFCISLLPQVPQGPAGTEGPAASGAAVLSGCLAGLGKRALQAEDSSNADPLCPRKSELCARQQHKIWAHAEQARSSSAAMQDRCQSDSTSR